MSRRFVLATAFLILTAPPPARAQVAPTQGITLDGQPLTPLARVGLERNWLAAVPLAGTERALQISLDGDLMFVQTSESNLHAYEAETGRYLWGARLGFRTGVALQPSTNSTAVFVTDSSTLFALDRKSGRTIWKTRLATAPSSGTTADEERVMVGLSSGKLANYTLSNRQPAFFWQTNGPISSRPISAGPVVAFASHDGRVYVAQKEPPKLIYRYLTGGPISATMGTYKTRTLIVPSHDNNVYAIDLYTAETYWSFTTGASVEQEPLIAGDDAYVLNKRGSLSVVEIPTGQARWTVATHGGRLLAVGETRVYLMSPFNDLFIVDRATGGMVADPHAVRNRAGLDLREFTLTPTNPLTGRIYLGSPSGTLICLREAGRVKPYMLRDPNAEPFGTVPRQEGTQEPAGDEAAPAADTAAPAVGDNPQ